MSLKKWRTTEAARHERQRTWKRKQIPLMRRHTCHHVLPKKTSTESQAAEASRRNQSWGQGEVLRHSVKSSAAGNAKTELNHWGTWILLTIKIPAGIYKWSRGRLCSKSTLKTTANTKFKWDEWILITLRSLPYRTVWQTKRKFTPKKENTIQTIRIIHCTYNSYLIKVSDKQMKNRREKEKQSRTPRRFRYWSCQTQS